MKFNLNTKKKAPAYAKAFLLCREDQIRTGDPLHPIQVRYRAAPLPEDCKINKK